ncbi:MAG: AarF/ABC1/UbiB kinase family protein, partial [Bacteriovoracaceae bacterium]|nr:AarF/ABC1/UbiB kinase family protein [Bacteriovoracaceae bacterium]
MDLIKTGIGITKTIRNVGRLREIATIFGRHGFDEFIGLGIGSKIPGFVLPKGKTKIQEELEKRSDKDWQGVIGYRLRLVFQELGPAFIKFGQLLSSREDIFDESFINEMKILRDKVKPIPLEVVKPLIETNLGKPIGEVFKEIDPEPLGTASIGVVYKAILLDGTDVVIKVKRPGIDRMIETDFQILLFLSGQIEKVSEEIKFLGLSRIIHDFGISLQNELNFNVEALNCNRLRSNLKKHDLDETFYLPFSYPELTTENILVMERLKGTPFSDQKGIEPHLEDLKPKLDKGVQVFMRTFLQDGFFHADLHGGNFFYLDNGQIGIIDFGLMGTLGKKGRSNFIAIIYALLTFNYENLVYEFLDVAEYDKIPDVESLIADVRDALSPFIGLTVSQMDFTKLLQVILDTLKKHQIFLPRDWFVVFRALMTLDGVGKSIGFDLDLYGMMENDIQDLIKSTVSKEDLIEEAVWVGRDVLSSARIFP